MVAPSTPIDPFLELQGVLVLDGGLATELEFRGHDLDHPLWSARLIAEEPEEIVAVNMAFMRAGADCVASASYQASIPGFVNQGMSEAEARDLLRRSVRLACEARDRFVAEGGAPAGERLDPIVAASVGPYGAYLADGSEFRGDYGIDAAELRAFHEPRWEVLVDAGADMIACETVPSAAEAEVLLGLLQQTAGTSAWISFSCKDGLHVSDGTPIEQCAALVAGEPSVAAVGINCTAPRHLPELITAARRGAPDKEVAVYPNSGETYDAKRRSWTGIADPLNFGEAAVGWRDLGARLIGGCCRTRPVHITVLRRALLEDR